MKRKAKILSAVFGISFLSTSLLIAAPPHANYWEIGPVIRGYNHSVGMPLTPAPLRNGWSFDFPYPGVEDGHVHYLTFRHGPLSGKQRIVMRYRIDARPGVRILPREYPAEAATLSLFFQRAGDSWTARGRFAYYRWYAPQLRMAPLTSGVHDAVIRLDDPGWLAVNGTVARDNREYFANALANADRVGFVMGSSTTRGHGVHATGPARFTLLEFRVE